MSRATQLLRRVAQLECKGLCITACGPIAISPKEMKQVMSYAIEQEYPADPRKASSDYWTFVTDSHNFCPFLIYGRCSIYPMRPMICRVWGSVTNDPLRPRSSRLHCPHGCTEEMDDPLALEEADFLIDYGATHNIEIIEQRMQKVIAR